MSTSTDPEILDATAQQMLSEAVCEARDGNQSFDFNLELMTGLYLGFDAVSNAPDDRLGHVYVYLPDYVYFVREDEQAASPHKQSNALCANDGILASLSDQLRDLLYEVVGTDQPFRRDTSVEALEQGGGTYFVRVLESPSVDSRGPEVA